MIVVLGAGCLITAYLAGPIIAGSRRVGDRLGPKIYPRGLHQVLYIIGHEKTYNIKPRISMDSSLYHRPWFYDQNRIPKSAEERQAVVEKLRQNESPMLEFIIERNKEIEQGEQKH